MRLKDEQARGLLTVVGATEDEEIDCGEFLAELPRLIEADAAGAPELEKARAHERLCANCREEAAALRAMLASDDTPP